MYDRLLLYFRLARLTPYFSAYFIRGLPVCHVLCYTLLHSPGDIVLQIVQNLIENPISLGTVFIAIFGGKIGQFEPNSLIGVVKDFINSKYEREKKAIEIRKLEAEADIAEQEALNKKLENIEKLKELQLSTADSYVEPLMDAAEKLQVQPSQSTILDITELMQKQSKSGAYAGPKLHLDRW